MQFERHETVCVEWLNLPEVCLVLDNLRVVQKFNTSNVNISIPHHCAILITQLKIPDDIAFSGTINTLVRTIFDFLECSHWHYDYLSILHFPIMYAVIISIYTFESFSENLPEIFNFVG